jgi:hypothetical protein
MHSYFATTVAPAQSTRPYNQRVSATVQLKEGASAKGRPARHADETKAELWRQWRAGESISVISCALRKPPGSVFTVLKYHGGIAPEAP